MFGRRKKHIVTPEPVSAAQLSRLAPLSGRPDSVLRRALATTESIQVAAGPLSLPGDDHTRLFLHRGSIRIVAPDGTPLTIDADTPPARFPLPQPGKILAITAVEPCTLLRIPNNALAAEPFPTPAAPELTPAEAEALEQLHKYYSSPRYELPALPDLALKIGTAIDRPETDSDDIARLVQLDPVLSTRILGVVNSAAFGGVSTVTSIQQAVSRLGRNKVRSLVFSCVLKGIFRIDSTTLKKNLQTLWNHSARVGALSYVLGRETPGVDAEQAMLGGLIHDIGSIAVIGGVSRFPQLAAREEVLTHVLDTLRVGSGLRIVIHWGLQNDFGDVVGDAENWYRTGSAIPEIADVVILARLHDAIGSKAGRLLPHIDDVPAFRKLANGELSPQRSLAILERAAADVREVQSLIEG